MPAPGAGAVSCAIDVREAFRIHRRGGATSVALQGLTLQVEEGEIVVVLGPSGSGKTTLLRTVAGFDTLSAGTARVLGDGRRRARPGRGGAASAPRTSGLLDQHYARALSPDLTCVHTVALGLELLGTPRGEARQAAAALLERVGLGDRLERRGRARSPAASSSESPSAPRSRTGRASCSRTSPPASSTQANARDRLRPDRGARPRAGHDRARRLPRRGGGLDRRPARLRARRPRRRGGPPGRTQLAGRDRAGLGPAARPAPRGARVADAPPRGAP